MFLARLTPMTAMKFFRIMNRMASFTAAVRSMTFCLMATHQAIVISMVMKAL